MLLVNKCELAENNSFTEYSQNKSCVLFIFFKCIYPKMIFLFLGIETILKLRWLNFETRFYSRIIFQLAGGFMWEFIWIVTCNSER